MKPILFNTEMVKAILAGRKTVTRRLIKLAPADEYHFIELETDPDEIRIQPGSGEEYPYKLSGLYAIFADEFGYPLVKSPYQVGDALYVRETWCKGSLNGGAEQYFYRADENEFYCSWKPSIHMPKGAARIFLRVTDVRVERLQDITDEQVIAEGIDIPKTASCEERCLLVFARYHKLWNSTIKKADIDKYGWEANPWTWVIEFERISKEEALKNV